MLVKQNKREGGKTLEHLNMQFSAMEEEGGGGEEEEEEEEDALEFGVRD